MLFSILLFSAHIPPTLIIRALLAHCSLRAVTLHHSKLSLLYHSSQLSLRSPLTVSNHEWSFPCSARSREIAFVRSFFLQIRSLSSCSSLVWWIHLPSRDSLYALSPFFFCTHIFEIWFARWLARFHCHPNRHFHSISKSPLSKPRMILDPFTFSVCFDLGKLLSRLSNGCALPATCISST